MLARQTVNVNQREKDLNIFYVTFLHNLHVNQGGKLTLQTDWNRTLLKPGCLRKSSHRIAPVPARLTRKITYLSGVRRTLCIFAKKLFRKLSLDNLCKRSLNSRPRYFKISVKVDNNSYIRKNWCWTWKSRNLRSAAIVRLLPLSSFSLSFSS